MRLRIGLILVLGSALGIGSLGCSRKLDPEPSCNFVQNTDLRRVSWNTQLPIRLYVHQSVPVNAHPEIEVSLRAAAQAWNQVLGREAVRIEAFNVGGPNIPARDGYSMIYWLSDWEADRPNEQARTTIFWTGAQIYEADIRINAKFTYHFGTGLPVIGVDFESLLIHEIGHALGLAHQGDPKSVMQVALGSGTPRRQIGKADVDSIRCEYM